MDWFVFANYCILDSNEYYEVQMSVLVILFWFVIVTGMLFIIWGDEDGCD